MSGELGAGSKSDRWSVVETELCKLRDMIRQTHSVGALETVLYSICNMVFVN